MIDRCIHLFVQMLAEYLLGMRVLLGTGGERAPAVLEFIIKLLLAIPLTLF